MGAKPSSLQPVEETANSPKKKKDDVENLQLSDSGLFKPMYPIDNSLKILRRLRKKHFPDKSEEELRRLLAEKKAAEAEAKRKEIVASLNNVKDIFTHDKPSPEDGFHTGAT